MKTNEELNNTPNLLIVHTAEDGGYGVLYKLGRQYGSVIWSTGGGWDHVSVSPFKHSHTPTWDEMCTLKDMFFREDETVVQFHPAKSEYVNNMPNCLHLWKPTAAELPTPAAIMVGIKDGQTFAEVREAVKEVL